jgi:hypothetical protein
MSGSINAIGLPVAHGGPRAAVSISRAAVYIDGFNLYHAIADLGAPHLKWVDLRALADRIVRRVDTVVNVVWCTAVNTKNPEKMIRWREYKKALASRGVLCAQGHFTEEPRRCPEGHHYFHPTEKEGDVNVAINLISDAHLDVFDVAYLVTADSDQLATARMFRQRFPGKMLISVAPPGRSHSKAIIELAHATRTIRQETIENCLFPGPAIILNGALVARRPKQYDPPEGWTPSPIDEI